MVLVSCNRLISCATMDKHPAWTEPNAQAGDLASDGGRVPPVAPSAPQGDMEKFEMPPHMEFVRLIGKGGYGIVAAFKDHRTGSEVAVKKIFNPFSNAICAKRCLREIKLLRVLEHEQIMQLIEVMPPSSPDFRDVYIVSELMDADLHTVINSPQVISDDHVQFFIYQILCALLYLHSANVVHRDLKPCNVLVNKDCDARLCDFGLARGRAGFSEDDDAFLRTEYVGTRWYRAPEVVLTSMEYTAAVDLWSVGCILGELVTRQPMFKGRDFLDQIKVICEVLGTPTDEDMSFIPQDNPAARLYIKKRLPVFPKKPWQSMFPDSSDAQLDLLDRLLRFDYNTRCTALDACHHEYLEEYHCEEEEILASEHVEWSFDDASDLNVLQGLIYFEAAHFHPEMRDRDVEGIRQRGWHDLERQPTSPVQEPTSPVQVLEESSK